MVRRSNSLYRWSLLLTKAIVVQSLFTPFVYADGVNALGSDSSTANTLAGPPLQASGSEKSSGQSLYLDTVVNGLATGLNSFIFQSGHLFAPVSTLKNIGFRENFPSNLIQLDTLPGVKLDYDEQNQHLSIIAPLAQLSLKTSVVGRDLPITLQPSVTPGALLNYDTYATQDGHGNSNLSMFTEFRFFNKSGIFDSTSLSQLTRSSGQSFKGESVRLDTSWSHSWPSELKTLRLGDTVTASTSWSRPTRIAGIQFSRDFDLQPYLVTTPLPQFLGSAALPSNVELYIDGMRQYSGEVPAGPFKINSVPSISGAGNAQVVLTDSLGRSTTLDFSLYSTQQLLQSGFSDWSGELGVVRENYGLQSFDYGHNLVASGTWRYGVSDFLTVDTHGETTHGLINGGVGASWLMGQWGVFSGSLATSRKSTDQPLEFSLNSKKDKPNKNSTGRQLSAGYDWRNNQLSLSLGATKSISDYQDLASLYSAPLPKLSAHGLLGYSTKKFGNFGVNYLHLRYSGKSATRYSGAYWFKSLGRDASVSVNLNQNLDTKKDRSIFIGFALALDHNLLVSSSVQQSANQTNYTVEASRSIPDTGGFGWRAGVRQGNQSNGGQAELDYLGTSSRWVGGLNAVGDNRYLYGEASGAVVLMDGHLFQSRHVDNAFALISTSGIADIPVILENRDIGKTNNKGYLLISPLNSYQKNQVGINSLNLPLNMHIDKTKINITPTNRAGTLVNFGIHPIRAAVVLLVDAKNKPIPLGSLVHVEGHPDPEVLVGFDGETYLENLLLHTALVVKSPFGECRVRVDYPSSFEGLPKIGPLPCIMDHQKND